MRFFLLWIVSVTLAASVATQVVTTSAVSILTQSHFGWYENVDALSPATPIVAADTSFTTPAIGTQLRLRMSIGNSGALTFPAGASFDLQYANATSGPWTDMASSTAWIFFDNPSVADGQIIVTTLLPSSTVGESYGESSPSAAMPNQLIPGDIGEWDWVLVNNSAAVSQNWFFRMISATGTPLDAYGKIPELTAVVSSGGGGGGGSGGGGSSGGGGGGGTGYYRPPGPPGLIGSSTHGLPVPPPLVPPELQVTDFNGDNRVDIVDLSIMLYYYRRSDAKALRYDLNNDGKVDFPDVSILMYYWTG